MKSLRPAGIAAAVLVASLGGSAVAKKKAAAGKAAQASVQTQRAIGELAGKFKWGMAPQDAMKIVIEEITARYEEKLRKEPSPFKQDAMRKEMEEQLGKVKQSYVKFDGQKTGWDVSLIDHEFAHKNDESMFYIWEKDQRRFLFFYDGKLWKQFIAFNAEHPAFAGKTFDDFADLIQRRYGPAAMTFRKLRTSDEQTLDHLEWPPAADFVLWAIDLTMFYGNYCLALMQKSVMPQVERERKENGVARATGSALVDSVTKPDRTKGDANESIVDEITGKGAAPAAEGSEDPLATTPAPPPKRSARGGPDKPKKPTSVDPLDGTNF